MAEQEPKPDPEAKPEPQKRQGFLKRSVGVTRPVPYQEPEAEKPQKSA